MPETPLNKRIFHVSQIGIYRYTDEKHIQREGKGERNTGSRTKHAYQKTGHPNRIKVVCGRPEKNVRTV